VCDVDHIGYGKGLTVGYGADSETASEFITTENLLHCRISADYFSKNFVHCES
jgi:hypothetical protein